MLRPAEMKQQAIFLRVEISLYVQHDGTDEQGLFIGFLPFYETFQFFSVGRMERGAVQMYSNSLSYTL